MIEKKAILARIKNLPTLSTTFTRLSALMNDERASLKDFEDILKPDPALTTNLLRLANSPYFGFSRKVDSVKQALTILGTNRVFEVTTCAMFMKQIPAILPGYGLLAKDFWQHCVAVAIFSEQLAADTGQKRRDLNFTAGLLHDIGKLVLSYFIAQELPQVLDKIHNSSITLFEAEKTVLGYDHADVGFTLAQRWQLPTSICNVIKLHHTPELATEDQALIDCIHTADNFAHSFGYGADIGELSRRISEDSLNRFNYTYKQIEQLVSNTMEPIRELSSLFA